MNDSNSKQGDASQSLESKAARLVNPANGDVLRSPPSATWPSYLIKYSRKVSDLKMPLTQTLLDTWKAECFR